MLMLVIKEALHLTDPEQIKEQLKVRQELMSQFVGSLYPRIVWDEIVLLRELYIKLTGKFDY